MLCLIYKPIFSTPVSQKKKEIGIFLFLTLILVVRKKPKYRQNFKMPSKIFPKVIRSGLFFCGIGDIGE